MLHPTTLISLLLVANAASAAEKIFVFSGQSNMCGYAASATDLPVGQQGVNANIQCYYDQQEAAGVPSPDGGIASGSYWRPTSGDWEGFAAWKQKNYWYVGPNPGDPWTTEGVAAGVAYEHFGPEFNAINTIQAALGGTIFLVKYAHGGTNLQQDWVASGTLYGSLKYWATKAVASRSGSTVAGFFWMQGEGDTWSPASSNYQQNLTNFIAQVRSDFGNPNLPFILGRISPGVAGHLYAGASDIALVRQAQVAVASADPHVAWVDTDDLTLSTADYLHFDTNSILTLGTRMGQAWLTMTASSAPPTVTITTSAPSATALSPIPFTITFSQPVTGFSAGDVTVTNGTVASITGSGTSYLVLVNPAGNGPVSVDIGANVVQNAGGIGNSAAPAAVGVTADNAGPTTTVAIAGGQANPATTLPVQFTVTFSAAVTGFTGSDVIVTTGALGTPLVTITGSGTSYTASVSGLSGTGNVSVSVPADVAQDGSHHPSKASNASSQVAVNLYGGSSSSSGSSYGSGSHHCGVGAAATLLVSLLMALSARFRIRAGTACRTGAPIMLIALTTILTGADALPVSVDAHDKHLAYGGRWDQHDAGGPRCAWSACSVRMRLKGGAVNALLSGPRDNAFQVFVDGKPTTTIQFAEGQTVYPVVDSLPAGEHLIEIVKRTEAFVGTVQFKGFQVAQGTTLLEPEKFTRHIEFIGDSITAGYGDEATNQNEHFKASTENAALAWASVTGRMLKADVMCEAVSGIWLMDNAHGSPMPKRWDHIFPSDANSLWDFSGWSADAVVIDLGTNDSSKPPIDEARWTDAYRAFIAAIRTHYPKAHIFLCIGPMGHGPNNCLVGYNERIAKAFADQGDPRVHAVPLANQRQEDGIGADWHPSVKTHQLMADAIAAAISKELGWH